MRSLLMIRVHWDVIYDCAPLPFDIFLNGAFEDDDMPRYVAAESGSLTLSLSLSVSSPHPRQLTSQGLTQPKPRQPRFCVLPFPSSSSAFEIPPGPRDATKLPEQTNRKKGHTCGLRASNGIGKMVAMAVQQWRLQLDSTKKAFSLARPPLTIRPDPQPRGHRLRRARSQSGTVAATNPRMARGLWLTSR